MRRLAGVVFVLGIASISWRWTVDGLVYYAARSSIGCPGRESLIAAALHHADPSLADYPAGWEYSPGWKYNIAQPEWIAWTTRRRDVIPQESGSRHLEWQVMVADSNLVVNGIIAGGNLSLPPEDADGDGKCEVVMDIVPLRDEGRQDIVWRAVVRVEDDHNEIVWLGLFDPSTWNARRIRLKPIWRDEDGDGKKEFAIITVEFVRTPSGGAFNAPEVIAVFDWTSPGGVLQTRSLPDDCGIVPWNRETGTPLRIEQGADLDAIVRELLPAEKIP